MTTNQYDSQAEHDYWQQAPDGDRTVACECGATDIVGGDGHRVYCSRCWDGCTRTPGREEYDE